MKTVTLLTSPAREKDNPWPPGLIGASHVSIPRSERSTLLAAQDNAHALVDMGVPVFACALTSDGDPKPPPGWEKIKPSHRRVDIWREGMALCAVTGVVYDVIDIDPRNGGQLSIKRLAKELGEDGPEIYWEVGTASGGTHLYIAAMGIGSHPGFMPGIDLKGGSPDGTSRGFVFIPPTIRPSKDEDNEGVRTPYRPKTDLLLAEGDPSTARLAQIVLNPPARPGQQASPPREKTNLLRQACLEAKAGEQRGALLKYTHELERRGYDRDDILVLLTSVASAMPAYNARRPWRPADLKGLLHKAGAVIGDATAEELAGAITPRVQRGGLQAYSTIAHEKTIWGWNRWIAVGDATLIDGDAGQGKSLLTLDVAARWSSGRAMPAEAESFLDPMPVLLLAPEDRASVTAGRLQAARADPSLVFRPQLGVVDIERKDHRGEKHAEKRATYDGQMLYFPDRIRLFQQWINEYGIKLVIIDPISAFLSEKTNSNNDASVRRALEPLSLVLGQVGCSAVLIRHLNKNTTQEAKYRGGGSVAFGAVSRIQVLAGEVPDGTGRFGLAQIKNNHLERKPDEVLTYSIEDSDIVADDQGNMVPRILWGDYITMSLRAMTGSTNRGPAPDKKHEVSQVLEEMFEQQDTWPVKEAEQMLKDAGVSENAKTVAAARADLGIQARPTFNPTGGVSGWVWTTVPQKHRRRG